MTNLVENEKEMKDEEEENEQDENEVRSWKGVRQGRK